MSASYFVCSPARFCISPLFTIAALTAAAVYGQDLPPKTPSPSVRQIPSQVFFEPTETSSVEPLFEGHGNGYSVFLSKGEVALVVPTSIGAGTKRPSKYQTVRLVFGSGAQASVVGIDELEGKSNYFSGSDPALWRRNVPHFGKVLYQNIYPGIDLIFYSRDGQLEFDYAVTPGAHTDLIHFKTVGGETALNAAGDLVIRAGKRDLLTIKRPVAY